PPIGTWRPEMGVVESITLLLLLRIKCLRARSTGSPGHECDTRMGLSVDHELFEHFGARRPTRDTIVRANRHHPTPRSGLGIERVELRLKIVSVHGRAEVSSFVVHNVVHVECVRHYSKWLTAHVDQERLVAA